MKIDVGFIPKPGDTIRRRVPSGKNILYIWIVCPDCGEGRWIYEASAKKPLYTGRCWGCALKKMKAGDFDLF